MLLIVELLAFPAPTRTACGVRPVRWVDKVLPDADVASFPVPIRWILFAAGVAAPLLALNVKEELGPELEFVSAGLVSGVKISDLGATLTEGISPISAISLE